MFAVSAPHGRQVAWTALRSHARRAFGREPNPLSRRVDRSRSRLLVALVLTLVVSPVIAAGVALTVLHVEQDGARHLAAHRHRVVATTVSAATDDPTRVAARSRAQAVWEYPPTGRGGGWITVPAGTAAGGTLPIWVDDRGKAASAPPKDLDMAANATLAGAGALAVVWLAAEGCYLVRRRTLDRRAERTWEPEWERVEPQWSGRDRRPGSGQL